MTRPVRPDLSKARGLARRLINEAPPGLEVELPRCGTALELAEVYDAVARDLLHEARADGRIHITLQEPAVAGEGTLIRRLVFRKLG
jgi:hypothetical protein